jgi:hypothetical protein
MTRDRLHACTVFLTSLLLIGLSGGCGKPPQGLEPDKLTLFTSETQLGPSSVTLTNGIRVELISKPVPGLLGGSGTRYPIAGERIRIVPVDPASDIRAVPADGITDRGGAFVCDVALGKTFGDQYLDIVCEAYPEIHKRVRFVTGVAAENNRQEVQAGDALPRPLRIRLTDADGRPMPDEPVYFTLAQEPGKGGKVSQPLVRTDTNGVAEVGLRTAPNATGTYTVRAEVANAQKGVCTRSFTLDAMALSFSGILVSIFGGLALFIFGMTLMSEGLQQVAGSKMKAALTYITRNRVTAILAGTVVTSLIQSSSATTVMTVGFVNAGLLSLKQAIGVVFGANIGTTITGQMVSFKLDGLALPSIIVGVIAILLARKTTTQGIARTILGFGLLFFGMTLMSDQLRTPARFPVSSASSRPSTASPSSPAARCRSAPCSVDRHRHAHHDDRAEQLGHDRSGHRSGQQRTAEFLDGRPHRARRQHRHDDHGHSRLAQRQPNGQTDRRGPLDVQHFRPP